MVILSSVSAGERNDLFLISPRERGRGNSIQSVLAKHRCQEWAGRKTMEPNHVLSGYSGGPQDFVGHRLRHLLGGRYCRNSRARAKRTKEILQFETKAILWLHRLLIVVLDCRNSQVKPTIFGNQTFPALDCRPAGVQAQLVPPD